MKKYLEEMLQSLIKSETTQASNALSKYLLDKTREVMEQMGGRPEPDVDVKSDGKGTVTLTVTNCGDCHKMLPIVQRICKQYAIPNNLQAKGNMIQGTVGLGDFRNPMDLMNTVQREINRL